MRTCQCVHCKSDLNYFSQEKIQLGQHSLLTGAFSNLRSGALEVDIYICPSCGKLEFFTPENEESLPQTTCPVCGKSYDFDCPKCPHCK